MNVEYYILESEKRHKKLFPEYDQLRGIGSPIPRVPIKLNDSEVIYVPVEFAQNSTIKELIYEYENIENIISEADKCGLGDEVIRDIDVIRCKCDFEYWAFTCVKIKPKGVSGLRPFILRPAQRKLLGLLEEMRLSGVPIRIILLKARQWGGSTLVQIYMSWLQFFHFTEWNSAIISEVEDQARNIRSMLTRIVKNHPSQIAKFTISNFEGSAKIKLINERNSIIQLGSMQKPDSLRSFDFSMLHLSEVGLWKKTLGKSPEDLIQNLRGSLSDCPGSLEVLESTAKGVGNFFHTEWLRAEKGESNSKPLFVAWFEIELYLKPFKDEAQKVAFINSLTMSEIDVLWEAGATLEGIHWYRYKANEMMDEWRMMSEYPTTPSEAFQSTGRRAFQPKYINNVRKMCIDPIVCGEMFGNAQTGSEALENLQFDETIDGRLKIWKKPDNIPAKYINKIILNRFCAFADIGGRSVGADKSDITVVDRLPMFEGGMPEIVANWNGNIDQDVFAWIAAQISKFYDDALLAVEVNSLTDNDTEGNHSYTILDEIAPHYFNLFTRTTPDQVKAGVENKYGFHTNRATKPMIIDNLNKLLRESGYVERDIECVHEMDTYEIKSDGTYGAVEGRKDDRVITRAGSLWLATSYMPPVIVKENSTSRVMRTIMAG